MAIREVLQEEMANSRRLEKRYVSLMARLPRGSIVRKRIRGRMYDYLVYREDGRVRFQYKGQVASKVREKYARAKKERIRLRGLLAQVRRQVRYLERALRVGPAV